MLAGGKNADGVALMQIKGFVLEDDGGVALDQIGDLLFEMLREAFVGFAVRIKRHQQQSDAGFQRTWREIVVDGILLVRIVDALALREAADQRRIVDLFEKQRRHGNLQRRAELT